MDTNAPLLNTKGQPITERELRRGMRINILAGSAGMMWAAVASGMPLTMFMEAIKAPGVLIGLSSTVQQFAMLLQVPTALLVEMLPARKVYWGITILLHRACWLFPAILPFVMAEHPIGMAYMLVLILLFSSLLAQSSTAAWWSWMSDLIPERLRGRFWATRQSITMCAYLVATIGVGYVLDVFATPHGASGQRDFTGFALVFGAAGILGCLDIIVHLGVPEPKPNPVRFDWRRIMERVLAPLRQPDFRTLTLAFSVWSFALGIVAQFGFVALRTAYGVSYTYMSVTTVCSALGVIIAGFLWAYVMDRIGARNFGVIMMILAPVCGLVWFFMRPGDVTLHLPFLPAWTLPQAVAILLVANFIAGAFYSGIGLTQISLLGALSSPQGRTMAMAVHWAIIGVAAAPGPVVGGFIMDRIAGWFAAHPGTQLILPTGVPFHFYHVLVLMQIAVCWFVAVPLLLRVKRRAGEMAFRTAVSRFVILNPVRVLSSIYNIYTMGASDTRDERAQAVRKLGEEKTAIAVADLIANLDDPSLDVRAEAVAALGNIGSPDAIEALLAKLEDPEANLVIEIARALRQVRSKKAVDSLLRCLPGSDRETACEIVRTLGATGSRRAGPEILTLLRHAEDNKVIAACCEALARLGEFSAVYEILPRMKSARTPQLNRTLTVALGDLLGQPGGFYRLLSREGRQRGSETESLLEKLARAVRHVASSRREVATLGAQTVDLIKALDNAYVEGQVDLAVRLMLEIGLNLADIEYGIRGRENTSALVETLVCRDERFGVGIWFLALLRDGFEEPGADGPDLTDVLLGIHFLADWARRYL